MHAIRPVFAHLFSLRRSFLQHATLTRRRSPLQCTCHRRARDSSEVQVGFERSPEEQRDLWGRAVAQNVRQNRPICCLSLCFRYLTGWFLPPPHPYFLHSVPHRPPLSTIFPLFAPLFPIFFDSQVEIATFWGFSVIL